MNDRIPAPTPEEWETMLKQARDRGAIPAEFARRISENFQESKAPQPPALLEDLGEYKQGIQLHPEHHSIIRDNVIREHVTVDPVLGNEAAIARRARIRDARRDMLFGLMMSFLQTLILVWVVATGRETPWVAILWAGALLWTGYLIIHARKWWRVRK